MKVQKEHTPKKKKKKELQFLDERREGEEKRDATKLSVSYTTAPWNKSGLFCAKKKKKKGERSGEKAKKKKRGENNAVITRH